MGERAAEMLSHSCESGESLCLERLNALTRRNLYRLRNVLEVHNRLSATWELLSQATKEEESGGEELAVRKQVEED